MRGIRNGAVGPAILALILASPGVALLMFIVLEMPIDLLMNLTSAAEGPMVRRLAAGGKWIRTLGPAASNDTFYITVSSSTFDAGVLSRLSAAPLALAAAMGASTCCGRRTRGEGRPCNTLSVTETY